MSNKNIKVGGIGYLRVTVVNVDDDGWFKFRTDEKHMAFILSPDEVAQAFTPLPKYDPCRPFREGDIVTPCQVKGRWCSSAWKGRAGMRFIVTKDEDGEATMRVKDPDSVTDQLVDVAYFQLVSPIEEQEPYYTVEAKEWIDGDSVKFWAVKDEHCDTVAKFYVELYRADGAQKAAEAERDRRNAEWRKEQNENTEKK